MPDELKDDETIGDFGGGSIFYGTKGILVTDTYSRNARLLPSETMNMFNPPAPTLTRIAGDTSGHAMNFINGCLNKTSSDFAKAVPLTEAVLMGNLAIKAYQLKELKTGKKIGDWEPFAYPGQRKILWDGASMRVANFEKANDWVAGNYRKGWELQ